MIVELDINLHVGIHQSGIAERKNRHIVEIARAMLNEMNLPLYFLGRCYLH